MHLIKKLNLWENDAKHLLVLLSFLGLIIISFFDFLPFYTQYALVGILPAIFFFFWKKEHLDHKSLFKSLFILITLGVVWDNIAIKLNIWNFPPESVSRWFIGIPLEEYLFIVGYTIIILGIYEGLPRFKKYNFTYPEVNRQYLMAILLLLEIIVLFWINFGNSINYFKWLLLFAIIPSIYTLFKKGEKINHFRLLITILIVSATSLVADYFMIKMNAWYYNDAALIGRIGIVPIDDLLWIIFITICVIGLYTSLSSKKSI